MSSIPGQVRIAFRRLRRTPGFTLTVLLTLTMGIGGTTAVFNVVNGIILRPLPHPDAHELVALWETTPRTNPPGMRNNVSVANFGDWRTRNRVFTGMAAHSIGQSTLSGSGEAEMVTRAWVTASFFGILQGGTALGRLFTPEEDRPDGPPVVLLSHSFWMSSFGGDPNALGRTLELNGATFEIIGVLEEGLDFLARDIQVWTPYGIPPSAYQDRGSHSLQVVARLRPGVSVAQAQGEMDGIAAAIRIEHPQWMTGRGVNVIPLRDEVVGRARPTLLALLAGVLVMLLIATLNVANLLLVRATGRGRELAVQRALGCSRERLVGESVQESLLLALAGGALGAILGLVGTRVLLALAPGALPRTDDVAFDGRVLVFALSASLITGVLFGIFPALRAGGERLGEILREGGRSSLGKPRRHAHRTLVVTEMAFSMVLLVGAGLLVRTFLELRAVDPGFSTQNVLTAKVMLPTRDYPDKAAMEAFYGELLNRVEALPQVTAAGFTRFLPMSDGPWTFEFEVEDGAPAAGESKREVGFHAVAGGYFQASGIPLLRGRRFDQADGVPVVIVNETMARQCWPEGDPLGRRIRILGQGDEPPEWRTVVGVVTDVRHEGLQRGAIPTVYGPLSQSFPVLANRMRLVVRTSGNPSALASPIRSIVRDLDPDLPLFDVRTAGEIVSASVARPRFSMVVLAGFAGVAALLALVGVYGVVSYSVRRRTREMGLRMALGAGGADIVHQAAREGIALAFVGVGSGTLVALGTARFLSGLLFGVGWADPATFAVAAASLGTAAALACLGPALRATRVDPITVLRED